MRRREERGKGEKEEKEFSKCKEHIYNSLTKINTAVRALESLRLSGLYTSMTVLFLNQVSDWVGKVLRSAHCSVLLKYVPQYTGLPVCIYSGIITEC